MSEDKKEKVKKLFQELSNVVLPYGKENLLQSFEDFFNENGYLTGKQMTVLIEIHEEFA